MDFGYQKNLTLQDRYTIEEGLNHGYALIRIAEEANHVNSTARSSLNNRALFELAELLNSEKLLKVLELKRIEPDKVVLTPQLFRQS